MSMIASRRQPKLPSRTGTPSSFPSGENAPRQGSNCTPGGAATVRAVPVRVSVSRSVAHPGSAHAVSSRALAGPSAPGSTARCRTTRPDAGSQPRGRRRRRAAARRPPRATAAGRPAVCWRRRVVSPSTVTSRTRAHERRAHADVHDPDAVGPHAGQEERRVAERAAHARRGRRGRAPAATSRPPRAASASRAARARSRRRRPTARRHRRGTACGPWPWAAAPRRSPRSRQSSGMRAAALIPRSLSRRLRTSRRPPSRRRRGRPRPPCGCARGAR